MSWYLLVALARAEVLPCEVRAPLALHLVLWERRRPFESDIPFGTHQQAMRNQLIERLFGDERFEPLASPGDFIAVFPEGFAEMDWRLDALAGAHRPPDLYRLLDAALAREGDEDPVDCVFHRVGKGSREGLGEALQRSVTGPMLDGWTVGQAEEGLPANPVHQRSVSHAEVMVHHAFALAIEHFDELDTGCDAPGRVTLTMVSTGGRSYDIDRAADRLRLDYGKPSLDYLEALQQERFVLRDEGWYFDKLTVYDLDLRAGRRPPALTWTEGQEAFSLDLHGRTPAELAAAPPPDPRVMIPEGLDLVAARAQLVARGREPVEVPLRLVDGSLRLADPAAFLEALLAERRAVFDWGRGSYLPELETTLQVRARERIDEGLGEVALLRSVVVPSPRLSVALNFFSTGELAAAGALSILLAGALGYLGFVGTRRRKLDVRWLWPDGDIIDLGEAVALPYVARDALLELQDTTPGMPTRSARLRIEVSLRGFVQAQVPVTDQARFQELVGAAWEREENALVLELRSPTPAATAHAPLTVRLRHGLIDHARVAQLADVIAGREFLEVAVELALRITDATGRYDSVERSTFQVLRLRSVPGEPCPQVQMALLSDYAARFMPIWQAYKEVSPPFASLYLSNPARSTCPTLPIRWRLIGGEARYEPTSGGVVLTGRVVVLDAEGEAVPDWRLDQGCSHETERVDLGLRYPPELHGDGAPVQWQVRVSVRLAWSAGEREIAVTEEVRTFRVQRQELRHAVCLDFGTSTTRVLVQDPADPAFGYLPLGEGMEADPEDLPSEAFVRADGTVVLAPEAQGQDVATGRYRESIKGAVLDGPGTAEATEDMERIVAAVLREKVATRLGANEVDVLKPSASTATQLKLSAGPRKLLIATLPNDADPRYRDALVAGIRRSGVFEGSAVMLLHEAEAVALWKAAEVFGAPPKELGRLGEYLNILVVDYGAGTSDAALVRVSRPKGGRQEIEVLSTGGARVGGRDVDGGFFDALAAESGRPQYTWATLRAGREKLRQHMEKYKILATHKQWTQIDLPVRINGVTEHFNAKLFDVAAREEIDVVLRRMAGVPLAVLLGRRPIGRQRLNDVHLVVLTGRAAQTPRLEKFVRQELARHMDAPPVLDRAPTHLLKAAVTLGARRYAQGLGGDFRPSHSVFRDRLIYLWLDGGGQARSMLLLDAGVVQSKGGEHEVFARVPRADFCGFYRTWMVPLDPGVRAAPERPWELGQDEIRKILDGQSVEQLPGQEPATPVQWDPVAADWQPEAPGHLWARVRIVIDSEHRVRVEPAHA